MQNHTSEPTFPFLIASYTSRDTFQILYNNLLYISNVYFQFNQPSPTRKQNRNMSSTQVLTSVRNMLVVQKRRLSEKTSSFTSSHSSFRSTISSLRRKQPEQPPKHMAVLHWNDILTLDSRLEKESQTMYNADYTFEKSVVAYKSFRWQLRDMDTYTPYERKQVLVSHVEGLIIVVDPSKNIALQEQSDLLKDMFLITKGVGKEREIKSLDMPLLIWVLCQTGTEKFSVEKVIYTFGLPRYPLTRYTVLPLVLKNFGNMGMGLKWMADQLDEEDWQGY